MCDGTIIHDQAIDRLLDLNGKIAVISGGSSGIGFGTARLLALKGAVSVILDIDKKKGKKAVQDITALGGKADFIRCDVTKDSDCRLAIESIVGDVGRSYP